MTDFERAKEIVKTDLDMLSAYGPNETWEEPDLVRLIAKAFSDLRREVIEEIAGLFDTEADKYKEMGNKADTATAVNVYTMQEMIFRGQANAIRALDKSEK
ncbi:MAG: hypothetical protein ACHQ1D_00750 [Nitrososphaerales archaeon]